MPSKRLPTPPLEVIEFSQNLLWTMKNYKKIYTIHDHVHQRTQTSCCLQFFGSRSSCISRMKNVPFLWNNMNPLTSAQLVLFKLDTAFFQGKKSVILPYSNIISRMKPSATLTNDNVTRNNSLYPEGTTLRKISSQQNSFNQ